MYLNRRFYLVCTLIIALFGAGYIWGFLFFPGTGSSSFAAG